MNMGVDAKVVDAKVVEKLEERGGGGGGGG